MEKKYGMKKIVLIGPESTGKTTLAKALAKHYDCNYVPEYARQYIHDLNRPYQKEDIVTIAKKQIELEETKEKKEPFLFLDTDLIVCKIWSKFKYGECHPWILKQINQRTYHHYLLCNIDLPWQADSQRENPNDRQELFSIYLKEMIKYKKSYSIIKGTENQRLQNAIKILESLS